jgi:CRP/FNR family transcriptional regulator, cyclic AMP receptor protein
VDAERVKKIEVFSSLSEEDLEKLARRGQEGTLDEGDVLVKAGSTPENIWAIEEGQVEVERDGDVVATLGAGDVVGEIGVVNRALRNATVTAKTSVTGFVIAHTDIEELAKEDPGFQSRLEELLEERTP